MKKRSNIAPIAIFFATMLVIHFLSSLILTFFHFRSNRPSFIFLSLLLALFTVHELELHLGFLMGLLSLTVNTITILPTSYLFSPFVTKRKHLLSYHCHCPTYLIGLTPYLVYKLMKIRLV